MEIHTPKLSQIIMTGLGLVMFGLAIMLNHYRPHNQGIADITHSIYERFDASSANQSTAPAFAYVSTLPSVKPKSAHKLADPTATPKSSESSPPAAALPTLKLAGGQPDTSLPGSAQADSPPSETSTENSHNSAAVTPDEAQADNRAD